jgi:hypothetical protein
LEGRVDAVLDQLLLERVAIDAENLRRAHLVAPGLRSTARTFVVSVVS